MESKWKFNVWKLGLTATKFVRVARRLDNPVLYLGEFYNAAGKPRATDLVVVAEQVVFQLPDWVPPAAHPNFPFGMNVESDQT